MNTEKHHALDTVCVCTCQRVREREITHLNSHGDVLLADIVVMLVSIQHDDSVG